MPTKKTEEVSAEGQRPVVPDPVMPDVQLVKIRTDNGVVEVGQATAASMISGGHATYATENAAE